MCVCVCVHACVCVYVCVSMSLCRDILKQNKKYIPDFFLLISRHSTKYSTIMAKSKKDRKAVLSMITHVKKRGTKKMYL